MNLHPSAFQRSLGTRHLLIEQRNLILSGSTDTSAPGLHQ